MTRAACRLAAALVAATVAGCVRRPVPNVIVIVLDAVRADRTGGGRGLTPFFDRLARRGTVFRQAFAASSDTAPSVASLLTSRYPAQHEVAGRDGALPAGERTLVDVLAGDGYQTFGFAGTSLLPAEHGWERGFRTWWAATTVKARAQEVRHRVLHWIDLVRGRRSTKPLFLYVHYADARAPYDPPPRWRARLVPPPEEGVTDDTANRKVVDLRASELSSAELRHLSALYDGEVRGLDAELRKLCAGLERRGLLDDAIVVVTADHGEEIGEHGLAGHGFSLYDQEIHVPLLLVGHGIPAGRVVDDAVSLVDVAPTVLELATLDGERRFVGRSLGPALAGAAPAVDVVAELPTPRWRVDPRRHTAAVVRGSFRLLVLADAWAAHLGEAELYDVSQDPAESRPVGYLGGPRGLPDASPELTLAHALRAALAEATARNAP